MDVDTEALRWFQQVADGVTVTEVGELYWVTQSGVSRGLARLEAEVGTPLLRRNGRTLRMTQAGAAFKVIGGIQKTSTLVQWAKVAVIDVGAKKILMDKLYTFRGDNDESWERAEIFVSREVIAALAQP